MKSVKGAKRCAIYTRKSSDERHETGLTTLQNQRDYCSAFIASQGGEGWIELAEHFDDGGFSGGTLTRPALKHLRARIAGGEVDVVVVYKIDRLSRSLRDFANLVAEFEAAGVTFVSVTQAFDTSTSMGRLTLNVLLSFAQFERELTGERLRDWFAGARAKGLWVPQRPYGYNKIDGNHLTPNPTEARIVQWVFRRYLVVGSCRMIAAELFDQGILNKAGRPWDASLIRHMLTHPVYLGEIVYGRQRLPGHHEPILGEHLWHRVQKMLASNRWHPRPGAERPVVSLLKGMLFDTAGSPMHHTFLHSKGKLYRYYVLGSEVRRYGIHSERHLRFRAQDLEEAVLAIADRLAGRPQSCRSRTDERDFLRRLIERVQIESDDMVVTFRTGATVRSEATGRLTPQRTRRPRGHPRWRVTTPEPATAAE